jgi:uncharacterized membrane protein YvlD (DUF360 family)
MTYDNRNDARNRDLGRARTVDTRDGDGIAKTWMIVVGVALLGAGLLGFVDNPIVSDREDALFHTGFVHNIVHILTGAVALAIGGLMHGRDLGRAAIAFGVAYALVLVATLISPDLFGIFEEPVNAADHGLHLVLAAGSIAAGLAAMRDRAIA